MLVVRAALAALMVLAWAAFALALVSGGDGDAGVSVQRNVDERVRVIDRGDSPTRWWSSRETAAATSTTRRSPRVLRFRADGTFKLAQFADLHYGEGEDQEWGPEQDRNSTRVQSNVLAYEKPDVVVYSGDQITGNNIDRNSTAYWAQVVQPCVDANTPWITLFGNHDDLAVANGTREELMTFDRSFDLSLSQFGPAKLHGVSNYVIPIYAPANESAASAAATVELPVSYVFVLDSGGGSYPEQIYADQVEWFANVSRTIHEMHERAGVPQASIIPSIAFYHIPIEQYVNLYNPTSPSCFGMNDDGVTPQVNDTALFQTMQSFGDVQATFVGHDHGNDWCCALYGIDLCYGRHTGYGGYGDWARGSRIIQLTYSSNAKSATSATASVASWKWSTWVRMEDGSIIDGDAARGGIDRRAPSVASDTWAHSQRQPNEARPLIVDQ